MPIDAVKARSIFPAAIESIRPSGGRPPGTMSMATSRNGGRG